MQTKIKNQYFKELIILNKICKDDEKFDDTDDNLSFKVTIFHDKCRQVGFSEDVYIQDISIML